MTGPVERVPLTDDKLDELEGLARDNGNILALGFIAELRASRARGQELQQRINRALARIDKAEPRQWRRVAVMRDIHAALTGTET